MLRHSDNDSSRCSTLATAFSEKADIVMLSVVLLSQVDESRFGRQLCFILEALVKPSIVFCSRGFRSSNPVLCTIRIRTSSTCTPTCVLPRRVAYPSSVVYVWMAAPYLCGDGLRQKTTSWKSMKICGPTSPRSVPMWVLLSRGSLWNVRYVASSSDILF